MVKRTKRRRRRKGGQLDIAGIANLKVRTNRWFQKTMINHMKENAQSIHQIAAGNSNVKQNVTHITHHHDLQAIDAMLQTMANRGQGAVQDSATFITMSGKKMVSIGNNVANVVAEYAPGMGQKLHNWFMPILNKSGTKLTAAFDITKDKVGNAVGWLNLHKPGAPDLEKATKQVKYIYDKLPTKEKIMGFVKVDGKTFSFVVDGGKATVKGVGSFLSNIGGYIKDAGLKGAEAVGSAGLKGAEAVGSAGLKGAEAVGSAGLKGAQFAMGGIKYGGKIIWQAGQGIASFVQDIGPLLIEGLRKLWPVLEFFGSIINGAISLFSGNNGGKRKRRRTNKKKRRRKRKSTKKKRKRKRKSTKKKHRQR